MSQTTPDPDPRPGEARTPPVYAPPPAPPSYASAPPPPPGSYGGPPVQVPPGMYFDPASGLVLPDGVVLAPVGRRVGAWFLSFLLFIVTLGIGWIIWGAILWGRGQSPAFSVLKMRCWRSSSNRPATFWWMVLRDFIGGIIEGLSIIIGVASLVVMLATKQRMCIHDFIGGTIVLYDPDNVLAGQPRAVR